MSLRILLSLTVLAMLAILLPAPADDSRDRARAAIAWAEVGKRQPQPEEQESTPLDDFLARMKREDQSFSLIVGQWHKDLGEPIYKLNNDDWARDWLGLPSGPALVKCYSKGGHLYIDSREYAQPVTANALDSRQDAAYGIVAPQPAYYSAPTYNGFYRGGRGYGLRLFRGGYGCSGG